MPDDTQEARMAGMKTGVAVLLAALAAGAPPLRGQSPAPATGAIRSEAALAQWQRSHAGQHTALDQLSPGARRRFLRGLAFRDGNIVGFSTGDLSAELDARGIADVLHLFDLDAYAGSVRPREDEPAAHRRVAAAPASPSELEGRFDTFQAIAGTTLKGESDADRGHRIDAAFDRLFPESRIRAGTADLADHDLWLLFRAAADAASSAPTGHRAAALEYVFGLLHGRGLATTHDHAVVQDTLVSAHLYEAANAFNLAHSEAGLAALPQVVDDTGLPPVGPTLLRLHGETWHRERVDLSQAQVLVLSGCHFAEDAARDIAADPVLGPAFAAHARWLSLPPGEESFDDVATWNRAHAPQRMEMVYDREEWTLFERWLMPTFIVLRDGREVDRFSGWPADESAIRRARLADAMRRAGLVPGAPR